MYFKILLFFVLIIISRAGTAMQVTVVNVGQGNCALVTHPGQPTLLIDAGSDQLPEQESSENLIEHVSRYLNQNSPHGISILISHPEKDHAGWMNQIISKISPGLVRNITVGGLKQNYAKFLPITWLPYVVDSAQISDPNPPHLPSYCSIWQAGYNQKKTNDQSLIICVEDANFRVIFPGDSGEKTFNHHTIVTSAKPTYLVANHHGSQKDGANRQDILQHIAPCTIVVSAGMHAKYFHPHYQAIRNFSHTIQPAAQWRLINAQTAPNLVGDEQHQAVINYTNGFSVYRTAYPIFTTNNSGSISINAHGVQPTSTCSHPLEAISRSYFNHYNFNTIRHLFLSRTQLTDGDIHNITNLPTVLTYFDLQDNRITKRGFVHLLNLLRSHNNRLAIKTAGNASTTVANLKEHLQLEYQKTNMPIRIYWKTVQGFTHDSPEPPDQTNQIANTPQPSAEIEEIAKTPDEPPFVEREDEKRSEFRLAYLEDLLAQAKRHGAVSFSTQLFFDEGELFIHYPGKTEWWDLRQQQVLPFYHTVPVKAAVRKNNTFFFSTENYTHIFEGINYAGYVAGSLYSCAWMNQKSGLYHTCTNPGTGQEERDLARLQMCFKLPKVQPISQDGNFLITIKQNMLHLHKKCNGVFNTIFTKNYPNLLLPSLCDADQSIQVTTMNGAKLVLPLIVEQFRS